MAAIDDVLPDFDVREVHTTSLACPPEEALARVLALPAAPDGIVRVLVRLRGLGAARGTIGQLFERMGFETLARTPTAVVVGASGTPWRLRGGIGTAGPGTVRIVTGFSAVASGAGSLLTTETRVLAADAGARRAFRRYWLVVRPFSGLIRRRWLRALR